MSISCDNHTTAMPTTVIHAGCKINLYLRVGPRRPDGYHDLDTLFLPLPEPHDTLEIQSFGNDIGDTADPGLAAHKMGLVVTCDTPGIDPNDNTLTRAYRLYAQATGFRPTLRLHLSKGIPHGAGLGGGSSDAAALLLWLQREAARHTGQTAPLEDATLNTLAARVGADVPFFLLGRPSKAEGIGEKLSPVDNPAAGLFLLLLCPEIAVSTAWAYAALDRTRAPAPPPPARRFTGKG